MKTIFLLLSIQVFIFARVYDLKDIYELAYINNENLHIAHLKEASSHQELSKSKSQFYPIAKIESEFLKLNEYPVIVDGVEVDRRNKRRDITFTVDQTIYDRSKFLDFKDKSTAVIQAQLERKKEHQQLMFDTVKYYFETIFKAKQIELSIQKLKRLEKILERAQLKYKSGFISKADLLEVKVEKSELLTQKLQYELDYSTSKSFLEKLIDRNNISIKENIVLKGLNMDSLDKYFNDYEANLDLKIQQHKLKRAIINKDISISKFEPTVTLNYEQIANDVTASEDQKKLTLLLTLNLFNGFSDIHTYEQAKIEKLIEEKSLIKLMKDVKQNIKNKVKKVKTFYEIILSYPEIIETKRFSLEGMRARFNAGTKSIIDLLDEENKYFEKLNDYTEYKYQFIIEYATLKQFTSSLDENFLNKINGYVYE